MLSLTDTVNRSIAIIDFIAEFKVASFSTLRSIFFHNVSTSYAYRMMAKLVEYGEIERGRTHLVNEHVYWLRGRKPRQLRHSLLVSEFYRRLHEQVRIAKFEIEYTVFNKLRPDAFLAYTRADGKSYIAFVEVEISGNKFNLQKYEDLFNSGEWRNHYPVFPLLIVISNKTIKSYNKLKVIQVREDFSDIEKLK